MPPHKILLTLLVLTLVPPAYCQQASAESPTPGDISKTQEGNTLAELVSFRIGAPRDLAGQTKFWLEIKNIGSQEVSIPVNNSFLFATRAGQRWPLSSRPRVPVQHEKPSEDDPLRLEHEGVKLSDTTDFTLMPSEALTYEFEFKKLLKETKWGWQAQPKPPKSPLENRDGSKNYEPLVLWVEMRFRESGNIKRSRPILVSPKELFDETP